MPRDRLHPTPLCGQGPASQHPPLSPKLGPATRSAASRGPSASTPGRAWGPARLAGANGHGPLGLARHLCSTRTGVRRTGSPVQPLHFHCLDWARWSARPACSWPWSSAQGLPPAPPTTACCSAPPRTRTPSARGPRTSHPLRGWRLPPKGPARGLREERRRAGRPSGSHSPSGRAVRPPPPGRGHRLAPGDCLRVFACPSYPESPPAPSCPPPASADCAGFDMPLGDPDCGGWLGSERCSPQRGRPSCPSATAPVCTVLLPMAAGAGGRKGRSRGQRPPRAGPLLRAPSMCVLGQEVP